MYNETIIGDIEMNKKMVLLWYSY